MSYRSVHWVFAFALEIGTGRIVRTWWRPAARERSWTGPARFADLGEVANAIKSGHAVIARIKRKDQWVLGPSVGAGVDERGRASIHLDGSPDSVDEALSWLGRNWKHREAEPD